MRKPVGLLIFASFAAALQAEVHVITLQDAVDIALKQNPDIAMARLDEQKAVEAVRIARDPFTPRISVGSGLAYSSGFPMSIEAQPRRSYRPRRLNSCSTGRRVMPWRRRERAPGAPASERPPNATRWCSGRRCCISTRKGSGAWPISPASRSKPWKRSRRRYAAASRKGGSCRLRTHGQR